MDDAAHHIGNLLTISDVIQLQLIFGNGGTVDAILLRYELVPPVISVGRLVRRPTACNRRRNPGQ